MLRGKQSATPINGHSDAWTISKRFGWDGDDVVGAVGGGGMIAPLIAALLAVQSSADRFDLICDPVSGEANETFRMSLDIPNDRWCYVEECRTAVHSFHAIEPNQIVLLDNQLAHYTIDRTTGRVVYNVMGEVFAVSQCRRAEFTMPDRLF